MKRYLARQTEGILAEFVNAVTPAYDAGRKRTTQLAILMLSICDGLSFFQAMNSRLVDLKEQKKMIETLLDNQGPVKVRKRGRSAQ